MQINILQLQQRLSDLHPSDEAWKNNVAIAYNNLKAVLNVTDGYQFNVKLENPLQYLIEQLNTLMSTFAQFFANYFMQPLVESIGEFLTLLQQIFNYLRDTLNGIIDTIINEIKAFCSFFDVQFFVDLKNGVKDFNVNVTQKIAHIGSLISSYISTLILIVVSTVNAVSNFSIQIPAYSLVNNIEVDVLNHFN